MMKPIDAPHRVYTRKGKPFVNFLGSFWGPASGESAIDARLPVLCEEDATALQGMRKDATITITQRKPHTRKVVEAWTKIRKLR